MPNGSTQTKEQRKRRTLEIWVDNPLLTFEEIAKLAGISDKTFWRYRQELDFMEEYHRMNQQRFKSLEGKAVEKLAQQVEEGNFSAVKYVLDGQGYAAAQKIDLDTNVITVTLTDD